MILFGRLSDRLFAIAMAAGLSASAAHATLGGSASTIEADRVHMVARHAATTQASFTVHTLTTPNGSVVREYARADGTVFAVAWQGPARPDLRQALGPYFSILNAENPPRPGVHHRPLSANRSDLVVRSAGHSGAFVGLAYAPPLMPAGVSSGDLK